MMRSSFVGPVAMASVLAVAFLGCNSILDNQPGTLAEAAEAGALPDPGPSPVPTVEPNKDGPDGGNVAPDSGPKPSPGCPSGQQMCFGSCVSLTDPLYGCGTPTCTPCPSSHSSMACAGGLCVVKSCDPGYADCNAKATDGCETDLSKATSCGKCNAACAAAAPLCAPTGTTFGCTNGCTPAAPLNCGAECADPMTSTNHCGNCSTKCPAVMDGTEACTAGVCTFTCKPQFHACADKCVAKTDPATCGAACTPCPVPMGGTATCVNDVCGATCPANTHLCGNKCVANSDATACGAACTVCPVPTGGTATCVADACGTTCPANTHLCGGNKCAGNTDPTACGAACTVCPVPANAAATCAANACGFTCNAGFGNCDANAANGCEATFATDPLNCGMCGKSCGAGTCVNGVCNP